MVLCHVSWAPQAFTWNSGWTFWPLECCCVLHQNVDVHRDLHLGLSLMNVLMSLWACSMRDIWFSGLYPQKVTSPYASKSWWIKLTKSALNIMQERDSGYAIFRLMLLWDIAKYYTIPNLRHNHHWLVGTRSPFCFAFYLFTNYTVHSLKHVQSWTFWP